MHKNKAADSPVFLVVDVQVDVVAADEAEAVDLDTLVAIAERLEGLAEALEQPAPND